SAVYSAAIVDFNGGSGAGRIETAMPWGRKAHGSFVFNNRLYVAGGAASSPGTSKDVLYAAIAADGALGSWTNDTNLDAGGPLNGLSWAKALVFNNKAYLLAAAESGTGTPNIYAADFGIFGVASPLNAQLTVSPAASTDAGGSGLHATPNKIEISSSPDCNGASNQDSDWQSAASFTGTVLSTSAPYFVRISARDAALNVSAMDSGVRRNDGCYGPFWPNDGVAPAPPSVADAPMASWNSGLALSMERRYHGSFAGNGRIYVVGGCADAGCTASEKVFSSVVNPFTGSIGAWTELASAPLPAPRRSHATVAYGGFVYALGGYDTQARDSVYYAAQNPDGTLGAWGTGPALPRPMLKHGAAVVVGGNQARLYVIGAEDSQGAARSEVYYAAIAANGGLGAWLPAGGLPEPRKQAGVFSYNGRLYVIGGMDAQGNPRSQVFVSRVMPDGTLASWSRDGDSDLSVNKYGFASALYNNKVYVIGGIGGLGSEVYFAAFNHDGTLGSWSSAAGSLPSARANETAVVFGRWFYVLGGGNDGAASNTDVWLSSITTGAVSVPQAQRIDISFSVSSDSLSSPALAAAEASTSPACDVTWTPGGASGWTSGTTQSFDLTGNNTYYLRLAGRDAAGNVSEWNGCFGPYWTAPAVFTMVSSISVTSIDQNELGGLLQIEMNTDAGASTFFKNLVIRKVGTLPDNEIESVALYAENGAASGFQPAQDTLISDEALFAAGVATITMNANQQTSGGKAELTSSLKTFYVALRPKALALPGADRTAGVNVDANSFIFTTVHRARGNMVGFTSKTPYISDAPSYVKAMPTPLAPGEVVRGVNNYAMMKMTLSLEPAANPSGGTAELKEIVIVATGTATDSDIAAIRVYRDMNSNGAFDADADAAIGPSAAFAFGVATYPVTHADRSVRTLNSAAPVTLFIVFDIAGNATAGSKTGVVIPLSSQLRFQGPSDVAASDNFPAIGGQAIITLPHIMTVKITDLSPATANQGAIAPMMKLDAWTDRSAALWDRLQVDLKAGEFDSDIKRAVFYYDSSADGNFQAGADTILTSGTFSTGGTASLVFSTETISQSTRTYFVVYEINGNAKANNNVTARILANTSLRIITTQTMLSAPQIPFESVSSKITETSDAMFLSAQNVEGVGNVQQGAANFPLYRLRAAMASNGGAWSGVKIIRTGTTPDGDFANIKIWRDNGDLIFNASSDTLISLGVNTFFNAALNLGLTGQELDVTTKYFFLTADMGANALVSSTFSLTIQSTGSVILVGSADYPVADYLPINDNGLIQITAVQQFPNTVTVEFTSKAPASSPVGTNKILMEKLRLYSNLNNVAWSQTRIDYQGSNFQDATRVYLHSDTNSSGEFEEISDAIIASGAFTSNSLVFADLGRTVVPGDASGGGAVFFVTVDLSSIATPGNNMSLRWVAQNYFTVSQPNVVSSTTFMGATGSVLVKPPPMVIFSSAVSVGPALTYQGVVDVSVMKIQFWTDKNFEAQIQKIRLNLTGGAPDSSVAKIRVFQDINNDGVFGLGDSLTSSGQDVFSAGTSLIVLSPALALNYQSVYATSTVFVVFDMGAQAAVNGSVNVGAGVNANSYITVNAPNTVSESGFPVYSNLVRVDPTVSVLNIQAQDVAPPYSAQGSTTVIFARLSLATTQYALNLTGLKITKLGSIKDDEVTNIRIMHDKDKNGVFTSTDPALTAGIKQFVDGVATVFLASPLTINTAGSQIFVALDFSRIAVVGSTVGVHLSSAADFIVSWPNIVDNAGLPFNSTIGPIADLTDVVAMSFEDIAPVEVGQGREAVGVVKIQAAVNEDDARITSIRLDKTGNLSDGFVKRLRLIKDNGDEIYDGPSVETVVATSALSGGFVQFLFNEPLGVSSKTYFVSVDVDSMASVGSSFGLSAGDGYFVAAGTDAFRSIGTFVTKGFTIRDSKTPSIPIVSDEGRYTASVTRMGASWASSVDYGTVNEYQYAVGTSPYANNVKDWTAVGNSTFTEIIGLSLSDSATYYVGIKAMSSSGNESGVGSSDGITVDIVKPAFVLPPVAQSEQSNIILTWNRPNMAIAGIVKYIVEERRADSPFWRQVVVYSTGGAVSAAGASPARAVPLDAGEKAQYGILAASDEVIGSPRLQVVISNKNSG
ncbi:MAG: hypothetical protein AAB091_04820, partial [Elusimicrobiota bacterium]